MWRIIYIVAIRGLIVSDGQRHLSAESHFKVNESQVASDRAKFLTHIWTWSSSASTHYIHIIAVQFQFFTLPSYFTSLVIQGILLPIVMLNLNWGSFKCFVNGRVFTGECTELFCKGWSGPDFAFAFVYLYFCIRYCVYAGLARTLFWICISVFVLVYHLLGLRATKVHWIILQGYCVYAGLARPCLRNLFNMSSLQLLL